MNALVVTMSEDSKKWLNYCKAVANVLTAVAALSGAGLGIYLKFNPQEPEAKESYLEVQKSIEKLSDNIMVNNRNIEMLFQMDATRSSRLDSIDSRLNSTLNSVLIATSRQRVSRSGRGGGGMSQSVVKLERKIKLIPKKSFKPKAVNKVKMKPYEQIQQQAQQRAGW